MSFAANSQAARDIAFQVHPQTNIRLHESQGPLIISKAENAYIYDDEGKRYFDGMAGLWCVSLGYSNAVLQQAAKDQIDQLPYQQLFAHRSNNPAIDLAAKLISKAPVPMSKVIFQCSGSEANDTAVKLVWYYWNAMGRRAKKKIIARKRAYHGTGIASGSLTHLPNTHREFDLPLPGFLHTTAPDFYREGRPGETEAQFVKRLAEDLEQLILAEDPNTIGGFFAEPIMATGGVIVPPEGYFPAIQAVLRKYEILCVTDEVICGFGRTGNYWGCTTVGFEPDMLTCAKSLSSAYMPISAVMVSDKIFAAMREQSDKIGVFGHGYTYGGHPVCAAVALAAMEQYDTLGTTANVQDVGPYLQSRLADFADHPLVGNVRGVGLMAGVELVRDKATKQAFDPKVMLPPAFARFALKRGLITRNLGDTMSLSPPLIITRGQVDEIVGIFAASLDDTLAWAKTEGLV